MDDIEDMLQGGELFSVDGGEPLTGDFTVSYDDVVVHERADLVERSVGALEGLAGVERVVHQDRELLVVRAPSLSAEDLERRLRDWWRDAVTAAPAWKEDLDALGDALGVVLEPHGFQRRKAVFNRETEPGLLQVVALERWRDDDTGEQRVDVLPGVWLQEVDRSLGGTGRPGWVSEVGCHLRLRDGPLVDHPPMGWPLAAGADDVARFAAEQVVPLLERLASRAGLLAAWDTPAGRIGMGGEEVARAAVLVATGDPDRARAVLQEAFERSRRGGRPRLHEITARLELPPLATGSAPDRSRAEDEFLERWTALPEEHRLEDVRSFVRALGGPAKKLDGSVASLGPLWSWMLDAVPRLQEAGPDGPLAAPTGLCRSVENVSDANRLLAENVAVYLGVVLLGRFPDARWDLDDAGFGLELAVSGLPAGVARVVERTCNEVARVVVHPATAHRRFRRRPNPLQDLVERWSTGRGGGR